MVGAHLYLASSLVILLCRTNSSWDTLGWSYILFSLCTAIIRMTENVRLSTCYLVGQFGRFESPRKQIRIRLVNCNINQTVG